MSDQHNPFSAPESNVTHATHSDSVDLFSPSGRIGRRRYLGYIVITQLLMGVVFMAIAMLMGTGLGALAVGESDFGQAGAGIGMVIFGLFTVVANIALMVLSIIWLVKRLHDLNRTGWWALLPVIGSIGFYVFAAVGSSVSPDGVGAVGMAGLAFAAMLLLFVLYVIFFPGSASANDYGPPPPPTPLGVSIAAFVLPIIFVLGIVAAVAIPAYSDYIERAEAAQSR